MVGAPVSTTRAPGAGVCETTRFVAYPLTDPTTRQAKLLSSRMPFANTNACERTSGTTRMGLGVATGGFAAGCDAVSVLSAAKVSVPDAVIQTTLITRMRGKSARA